MQGITFKMSVGRPPIKLLAEHSCDSFPALCLRMGYDLPYKLYIFVSEQTVIACSGKNPGTISCKPCSCIRARSALQYLNTDNSSCQNNPAVFFRSDSASFENFFRDISKPRISLLLFLPLLDNRFIHQPGGVRLRKSLHIPQSSFYRPGLAGRAFNGIGHGHELTPGF